MQRFPRNIVYLILTCVSLGCFQNEGKKASKPSVFNISPEQRLYDSLNCMSFFDSLLPGNSFNGGILVARKGVVVYEKYNGTVRLNNDDIINSSTPFHIASSSKPFTAMAILRLKEEGKLKLTDSLQQYFPGFPYKNVTIELLLTHRSALPEYIHFLHEYWEDKKRKATNQNVLNILINQKPPLRGSTGKSFQYCNTNYLLLALIIEKVSGTTYPLYLKKVFFDPLQMNNTFVYQPTEESRITPSFRPNGIMESSTFLDQTYGDKNIYSTVRDMLKWDQAFYTDFFSDEIKKKAFTPTSFEKKGINNYGMGWRMYVLDSTKKIIYHNGWWHSNNSCFYRAITDSVSIIILGNKMNNRIYHVQPLVERLTQLRFPGSAKSE